MKIIKNTLEVITSVWEDPGDYPNALARGPLPSHSICVEDVEGYLLLQIDEEDRSNEDYEGLGPEIIMMSMMEDHDISVSGVIITSWQFCPKTHPNPNDAAGLDMWKVIPYKWNSDNFDL